MAFWSKRASRANALQQAFNVAYAASLQSILLESNQELPAALDAYKATLMGIETALATIDLEAVQYGQEKSLLASISDISKQCRERIAYIERQLDAPELINHPYGISVPTSNDTPGSSNPRAGSNGDHSSLTTASTSKSSINRVAVGTRQPGSSSSKQAALPPKAGSSSQMAAAPPPVPAHRTRQPQPRSSTEKPPQDIWSGFDWSPANSADVLIPSIPPAPPVKPAPVSAPPPPPPSQPAPQVPQTTSKTASQSATSSATQIPAPQGSDAKVARTRPSAPAPAKSTSSFKSTKDMLGDKKYQLREPRRSGERSRSTVNAAQVQQLNRTASGGSQSNAAEASRSAPLLGATLAALTSSPASSAGSPAAQSFTPAALAPARRTNRYVVTKSSGAVVSQRSGHSATEAAKNAALLTASRRAKTNVAASGMSSVLTSTATAAQRRRQQPSTSNLSVSTQSSQSAASAPHSALSTPTAALLPAFDQLDVQSSPESVDSTDSEARREAEWDAMAREKIKGLRGVDQAAAENILNEIVLKGDPVHWDDIAGLEKAKASLKETVVYPFLRPDLFSGLREPALGMLLFGPPGTGKTMLARAVATESKSTFFSISASSLTSKYMGESEKLVRALFQLAKALAPSIIFVDEIDSILTQRRDSGEHEASRRIKNEFLVHWSDLQSAAAGRQTEDANVRRVLVLGATNLPWAIDEAARRRFVRRQYIPLPELETRNAHIRKLLSHQKHMLTDEDIAKLVADTEGYSGSDLTALAKDAALGPLRELGDKLLTTAPDQVRPIGINDFELSMQTIRASVGPDSLKVFEDWAKLYGSSGA